MLNLASGSSPAGHRRLAIIALSCLLAATLPTGTSQIPGSVNQQPLDLEVTALLASDAIVVGEENQIQTTVRNNGRMPLQATVLVSARNDDGTYGPVALEDVLVPGRSEVTVPHVWDNEANDGGPLLTGPLRIRAEVYESREQMLLALLQQLGISSGLLFQTAESVWDAAWGGAAEAQVALEEILFQDNEQGLGEWNLFWENIHDARDDLAAILFAPELPERLDMNPSNDAREVERLVVSHASRMEVKTPIGNKQLAVDKGEEWKALVLIHNDGAGHNKGGGGNAQDTLDLSLTAATPGWTFTLDKTSVALPHTQPPSPQWVTVTIRGPTDAPFGQQGEVTLMADSRSAPITGGSELLVKSPPVSAAGNGFSVSIDPLFRDVAVGATPSFDIRVVNRQNAPANVAPAVIAPAEWPDAAITPESRQLAAGETYTFRAALQVPDSATAGTHEFKALISLGENQVIEAPNPHRLNVAQWHGVRFVDVSVGDVVPGGEPTAVELTLENLGNGPDVLEVTLQDAPIGWALVDATREPGATFEFDAFEEEALTVFIESPTTTPPGTQAARLRLTSASGAFDSTTQIIHVQQIVLPQIELGECPTIQCTLDAGQSMDIDLTLRNAGNVQGTLQLQASLTDGWSASVQPASLTLPAGGSASAVLTLASLRQSLQPGDAAQVAMTLTAVDQNHAQSEVTELLTVPPAFPDVAVDLEEALANGAVVTNPAIGYRNLPGELLVPLRNLGAKASGQLDIRVTYKGPDGATVDTRTKAVESLGPGQAITVAVALPTGAGISALTAHVNVDPNGAIDEYSKDNNVAQTTVALRTFSFTVTPPSDMAADPGQAISLEGDLGFIVQNAGNHQEVIEVTLDAEPAWTQGDWGIDRSEPDDVVRLTAGSSRSFGKNFFVPEHPESLTANITLRVQHAGHAALFVEKTFRIHVKDTEPPEIRSFAANPSSVTLGASPNFTAEIWDASGKAGAEVVLKAPDGGTKRVKMTLDKTTGLHYAVVPLVVPGQHTWHVWARDASMHVTDTSDAPKTVGVSAKSAPLLRLVETSAGSTIRPGTMLAISVSNTTGVKSASVTFLGSTTTLAPTNPLLVPTESWPDGERSIIVDVVDRFDTAVKRTFNVTVDGTPPAIFDADISQEIPGRTAVVKVRVEDPAGIASVRLRVDPGRRAQAEELPMEDKAGMYTIETSYPYRDGSLTVIAEDAAGNLASRVIAGDPGAIAGIGEDQGASSLGAILAVMAFMATAWRRRQTRGP